MAPATNTDAPVTIWDLEAPVRDIRGLSVALYCAIEGSHRCGLGDVEVREALSALAGTIGEQARTLETLWEQAFNHHNRERRHG